MSEFIRRRKEHYKNIQPKDPAIQAFYDWLPANRSMYGHFRLWLKASSYSISAINIYGVAARQAIGFLQKPYWEIDPDLDLKRVFEYLSRRNITATSLEGYRKGLAKWGEYLYLRQGIKIPQKTIHWPIICRVSLIGLPYSYRPLWRIASSVYYQKDGWSPVWICFRP